MMDFGFMAFLVLTAFNFAIAFGYRWRYEKDIKKKDVTSNQLDRLAVLEQIYVLLGVLCLAATLIIYNIS